MKVAYTEPALEDLDQIRDYVVANYPTLVSVVEEHIHTVIGRIGEWPESAQAVAERPDVRVAPVVRYSYKVFYRIAKKQVEILHIYHSSRESWVGES